MNLSKLSFSRSQQNNIDLLRALAIISVFIHHAQNVFGGDFPFFGNYGGQFGPQIFFVISGYLIIASCKKHTLKEYFIHRFFRIFPAYWFYFIGIGVFGGVVSMTHIQTEPLGFIVNMLLLQHLFPSYLIQYDVLHVTWTLTVEILWYLIAPFLLWLFGGVKQSLVIIALVISTAFSMLAHQGFLDIIYSDIVAIDISYRYLFLSNNFLVQLIFFLFGAYIYMHREQLQNRNILAFMLIGLLIFLLKPYYFFFNPIVITGIGISCFLVAGISSKPVKNKLLFFISEISYSIYLCHLPILLFTHNYLDFKGSVGVLISIGLTFALSTFGYFFIEKPGMRLGRIISAHYSKP